MRVLRPVAVLLLTIAIAMVLAAGLAQPPQAEAHAILERSLPVQNQKLAEQPELVETWYSETLERSLTSLEVLDTQGNAVQAGETLFSDTDPFYAAIALPLELGPGIYTVTYQNVSTVDGHTWSGFFTFIVLNPDGTIPAGEALIPGGLAGQVGFLPGNTDSALRWLGLLAAVGLAGSLLFLLLIARPAAQFMEGDRLRDVEGSATAVAAAIALPAAAILIFSNAGQLLLLAERLGGLSKIGDILFVTRSGELLLSRIGLSAALLLLLVPLLASEPFRAARQASAVAAIALLGSMGALITYSLSSHAGTGGGAFWAVASDFVHFAATAAWLGALLHLPLLFWWTRRLEKPHRLLYLANVLDRFSWLAAISVALLIGTGAFNGFVQLPTVASLWETTYGRVLIAKIALILPLLGIAGINAYLLKPALVDAIDGLHGEEPELQPSDEERARLEPRLQRLERALPRTIIAEFLLGAVVLASVGVLAQSATAEGELRQAASQPSEDFVAVAEADDLEIELSISPFGLGVNTYAVKLAPKPGAALGEVQGVKLIAVFDDPNAPPSAGTTGTSQELEPTDEAGVYAVEAALLTQPGDWRLQTRIRRRGVDDVVTNFSAPEVGGFLARADGPEGLFALPFTFVDWNIVAGGAMVVLGLGAFFIWRNRPPSWRRDTSASVALSGAFAMVAGAVLLFGVHAHDPASARRTNPFPATQESLAIGGEIYERNCLVCHGREGKGDGPGAANLEFPPADLSQHVPYHGDGTFFLWISDGIPFDREPKNMPAFQNQLTEEERWHVINFLREAYGSGVFEPVLPDEASR